MSTRTKEAGAGSVAIADSIAGKAVEAPPQDNSNAKKRTWNRCFLTDFSP